MGSPPLSINPDEYFRTDPGIPFHLLRRQKASSTVNGSSNLSINELDNMLNKFNEKNIKDSLSSFLPNLPGYIDVPSTGDDSLQSIIEKPPVGGRELVPFSESALQAFRLMPGSVPEQFKFMNKPPEKKKKKKHKHHDEEGNNDHNDHDGNQERKHKKRKREDHSNSVTGEKKKKEKKKKKKKDKKGEHEDG